MLNLVANGPSGYNLTNSLRTRSSASAYLSRTPASAGNRTTWTWSGWVKRGTLGSAPQALLGAGTSGTVYDRISFENDQIRIVLNNGTGDITTTAVYRDPSSWYHVVVAFDTTQATASNRVKIYVNGTQVTSFSASTYPAQNYTTNINNNIITTIGALYTGSYGTYLDGYQTEINFIDGQQLTPSSFGSTNSTTGVWQPAKYTGTYGTNGFYLNFSNIALTSGSNTGLGKDYSGNGNYWNTNNISVTSGTTYDAMTDVPTLTSATVANYPTLNPLSGDGTLSSANLNLSGTDQSRLGTMAFPTTGQWYFEMTMVANAPSTNWDGVGIATLPINTSGAVFYIYRSNGNKLQNGGSNTAYGATYATGDVIGVAYDAGAGTLVFYKNNSSQGTAYTGISGEFFPVIYARGITSAPTLAFNAGQRPFTYTPPTGYVALNTYNLPTPTILQGNKYMDATLYTGQGVAQTVVNAGQFKPDFVWQKARAEVANHRLVDSVRGVDKVLYSSSTAAEATTDGVVDIFNSNGFTGGGSDVVTAGQTAVAWQWQAGQGTTSSNTSGSITSTVSVNASAGFSVVTWTAVADNSTIGHGLGVTPAFIITKSRSNVINWVCYHKSLGANGYIQLNLTNAAGTASGFWGTPNSTTFGVSANGNANNSGNMVAYCWAEIAGFSKFGSYTGNGSTDGTFVYTGFRPKFLMVKVTSTTEDWYIWDANRGTYNANTPIIYADLSAAEGTAATDFLSNGFKPRTAQTLQNASGATYIYMAFAENPTKFSLAR